MEGRNRAKKGIKIKKLLNTIELDPGCIPIESPKTRFLRRSQ
jgi:hypothetical protein